jgi:hypothetical protein
MLWDYTALWNTVELLYFENGFADVGACSSCCKASCVIVNELVDIECLEVIKGLVGKKEAGDGVSTIYWN